MYDVCWCARGTEWLLKCGKKNYRCIAHIYWWLQSTHSHFWFNRFNTRDLSTLNVFLFFLLIHTSKCWSVYISLFLSIFNSRSLALSDNYFDGTHGCMCGAISSYVYMLYVFLLFLLLFEIVWRDWDRTIVATSTTVIDTYNNTFSPRAHNAYKRI